jgi:hypothetical protein
METKQTIQMVEPIRPQCAVFANPITRFKLSDVTVQNAVYSGVFLRNDTETVIDGCYFLNNGKTGVTGGVVGVMIDGLSNSTFSTGTKVKNSHAEATSIGDSVLALISDM